METVEQVSALVILVLENADRAMVKSACFCSRVQFVTFKALASLQDTQTHTV